MCLKFVLEDLMCFKSLHRVINCEFRDCFFYLCAQDISISNFLKFIEVSFFQQVQRVIATDEAPAPQLEDLNTSDQSEEGSLDENTIETMISIEEANRLTIGLR